MRVLHVVASLDPRSGGPARCVRQLAETLNARGIDVTIAAGRAGEAGYPGGAGAVPLAHLPIPWRVPTPGSERRLGLAIAAADVVHLHGLWNVTVSVAAYQCRRAGVPYVITPHGMLDPVCLAHHARRKRLYRRLVEHATLRGASGLHFLSAEERRRAAVGHAFPPDRLVVAPNGAPRNGHLGGPAVLRSWFPELAGRRVVLYLGRLDRIKGIDLQLAALARIPESVRPTLLVVGPDYGDGRRLRRLAGRLGLDPWVVWGRPIYGDARLALMAEADAVLLTSAYDCNPVVAAETLGAGGVLVGTETCGGMAQAAARRAAVSVPRDPDALARALQDLLRDPAGAAAIRRAALAYAASALRPADLVEPLISLYRTLSGGWTGHGAEPITRSA